MSRPDPVRVAIRVAAGAMLAVAAIALVVGLIHALKAVDFWDLVRILRESPGAWVLPLFIVGRLLYRRIRTAPVLPRVKPSSPADRLWDRDLDQDLAIESRPAS